MRVFDYPADATKLLANIGVQQAGAGVWAFTDVETASRSYLHHTAWPAALVAYAAVDPVFARGRLPGRTLIELLHRVPGMDGAEHTAIAQVCGAPAPTFDVTLRPLTFGRVVAATVVRYALEGCFERVAPRYGSVGQHYGFRPRGFAWAQPGQPEMPAAMKALRKAYRALDPVQQVMALSILHLYLTRPDKHFLIGCKTKILAADALQILRDDGDAIENWGQMVSHYAGW